MADLIVAMFLVLIYDPIAWIFFALYCICIWAHDREILNNLKEVTEDDWNMEVM